MECLAFFRAISFLSGVVSSSVQPTLENEDQDILCLFVWIEKCFTPAKYSSVFWNVLYLFNRFQLNCRKSGILNAFLVIWIQLYFYFLHCIVELVWWSKVWRFPFEREKMMKKVRHLGLSTLFHKKLFAE